MPGINLVAVPAGCPAASGVGSVVGVQRVPGTGDCEGELKYDTNRERELVW